MTARAARRRPAAATLALAVTGLALLAGCTATTGPVPVDANSLNAGTSITGRTSTMATASMTIVPIFMNVDR